MLALGARHVFAWRARGGIFVSIIAQSYRGRASVDGRRRESIAPISVRWFAPANRDRPMAKELVREPDGLSFRKRLHLATLERWIYVAWFSFVVQFRRTTLGPLWLILNPLLFIILLGTLYAKVGRVEPAILIPSMTVGVVVWTLIGGFLGQSATVFQRNRAQLLQGSMNLTEIALVEVITIVLQFMHQILIIVGVFIIFLQPITLYSLLSLVGLALVIANGYWLTMVFGIVGARYRDLAPVMTAVLRIAFLATPIIWVVPAVAEGNSRGGLLGPFLFFNPFYHFLEIIRAPLLGNPIAWPTWIVVLLITISGFALLDYMQKRFARLVPLWV